MSICDLNLYPKQTSPCIVDWKNNVIKEIKNLIVQFPDNRSQLEELLKSTDIREVTYAGKGSFDNKGKYNVNENENNFKYLIRYHHGNHRNLIFLLLKCKKDLYIK